MFLRDLKTNELIEVMNNQEVFNPFLGEVHGRTLAGEDTMDEADFEKDQLAFPSGESLPMCWRDRYYRRHAC
jgi:hypothetical protein